MVTDDVIAILNIIKVAYPRFYSNVTKQEADDAVNLWSIMFADDDAKVVTEAVKAMIATLKYPPTIADVKEKIRLITTEEQMTELEAWNIVYGAICCANYYAEDCFERFPEVIKRVVGTPKNLRDWALMEPATINSVIQSNFMRSYTSKVKHVNEIAMMPTSTKIMMEGIADKLKITEAKE